jgi:anti-anti-sigma factor
MSFTVTAEIVDNIAKITLIGELDSGSASKLQEEINKLAINPPKELVLFVKELNFMASAGLRMIVFAKQKLGANVPIYMVQPQDQVVESLTMTGFIQSVHIVDKYPI